MRKLYSNLEGYLPSGTNTHLLLAVLTVHYIYLSPVFYIVFWPIMLDINTIKALKEGLKGALCGAF